MKKKLILLVLSIFLITGCDFIKIDSMEDISIITTNYSIEYIIRSLYGDHSIVTSIYPDDTDTYNYVLNDKALTNYAKKDLFVYLSYGGDKDIAVNLLKKNNDLLIIDASLGMKPDYLEELWLNPSNMLMIAHNIRNGLKEFMDNTYLEKNIDDNYEKLKLLLSELDADIKITCENGNSNVLVVADKSLNYLSKYGYTIISLDDDNAALDKSLAEVSKLANSGAIKYVYSLQNNEINENIQKFIDSNSLEVLKLKRLDNISTEDRNNGSDYIKVMNYNLELIKKETYK